MKYDLIVAGGGPTGLAAAIEAVSHGWSVAVFEPRSYPIDKACGEGLMPGGAKRLRELGVEEPQHVAFEGIRLVRGERSAEARFRSGRGMGIRRSELSRVLHSRAKELGVELIPDRVRSVSNQTDRVSVNKSHEARWLIAADGLHSTVARLIGAEVVKGRRNRIGLRAHFERAPWSKFVEVYLGDNREAYLTPVAESMVGVAILSESGTSGRFEDELLAFPELKARLGPPIGRVMGAGPFPSHIRRRVHGRVLFVGDAAGFLDPITGEGAQLGLVSAQLAVDAITRDRPEAYHGQWWRATRGYWWLTSAILAVRRGSYTDPLFVPTLERLPWLFQTSLWLLGDRRSRSTDDEPGRPVEGEVVPRPI